MRKGGGECLRDERSAEGKGEEFIASFASDFSHRVRLTKGSGIDLLALQVGLVTACRSKTERFLDASPSKHYLYIAASVGE